MGRITFEYRGIIRVYNCTCSNPEPEPSDMGVWCMTCGARAAWPEPTAEELERQNQLYDQLVAQIEARKAEEGN